MIFTSKIFLGLAFFAMLMFMGCDQKDQKSTHDSNTKKVHDDHAGHDHGPAGHNEPSKKTPEKEPEVTKTVAYPLETCVVSGEELGSMGEPIIITHEGQEVKFCCKSCVKSFNADPAKYIAKIKEASIKKE